MLADSCDYTYDIITNKYDIERRSSKFHKRSHQKVSQIEKKNLQIARKKLDHLVTCKRNRNIVNKQYEQRF